LKISARRLSAERHRIVEGPRPAQVVGRDRRGRDEVGEASEASRRVVEVVVGGQVGRERHGELRVRHRRVDAKAIIGSHGYWTGIEVDCNISSRDRTQNWNDLCLPSELKGRVIHPSPDLYSDGVGRARPDPEPQE